MSLLSLCIRILGGTTTKLIAHNTTIPTKKLQTFSTALLVILALDGLTTCPNNSSRLITIDP